MRRLIRVIRNVVLLAVAAIGIVADALAFNTLTRRSRQLHAAAVPRAPNERISIRPFPGSTDPPPVTATASPSFKNQNCPPRASRRDGSQRRAV
jgi:hypothetical protein